MTTFLRIVLVLAVLLGAAFHVFIDQLTKRVERQYLEAAEEPMVDTANILAAAVESRLDPATGTRVPDPDVLRRAFEDIAGRRLSAAIYDVTKTEVGMHAYVTDADGIVLFDSADPDAAGADRSDMRDVALTLRGRYGARSTRSDDKDDRSSVMFVGAPVRHGDAIVGCLSVSKPQANMFVFMGDTQRFIVATGWLVYAGTLALIALAVFWFTRPIHRLTWYARAVQRGERPALRRSRNPEVATLGDALEEMRDALEGRKYAETYVQTLTHEMKSPVAAIRGAAELLEDPAMPDDQRRRFLANIENETARLQASIDRLLALSSIESRRALEHPARLDLVAVTRSVLDTLGPAAAARGIRLELADDPAVEIVGESFLVETAVSNLVQNALDFSPADGTVTVAVRRDEPRHRAVLTVTDEGPGIPDYALERVFERFYSLQHPATGRKSSGLGLCFVRESAELHGGTARVENRTDGRSGARATLEFPLPGGRRDRA